MQKNDKDLIVQAATKTARRNRGVARLFYGFAGVFALITGALYTPGHRFTSVGLSSYLSDSTMSFFAVAWFLVGLMCVSGVVSVRVRRFAAPAFMGLLAVLVAMYMAQWLWADNHITIASVKNYVFMWIGSYCAVSALGDDEEGR